MQESGFLPCSGGWYGCFSSLAREGTSGPLVLKTGIPAARSQLVRMLTREALRLHAGFRLGWLRRGGYPGVSPSRLEKRAWDWLKEPRFTQPHQGTPETAPGSEIIQTMGQFLSTLGKKKSWGFSSYPTEWVLQNTWDLIFLQITEGGKRIIF